MSDSTSPMAEVTPEIRTLIQLELVGAATFAEQLSVETVGRILSPHDQLVRDLLPRFDGREIDKTNRYLLLFERPIDAVRYSLAYHDAVAALSRDAGQALTGRIGIHLGEVFLRNNPLEHIRRGAKPLELEGLSRTTVARLMSLAHGGQILMTKTAHDLAHRASLDVADLAHHLVWRSHGPYRFAGVEDVFDVYPADQDPPEAPQPGVSGEPRRTTAVVRERTETWRPAAGEPIPHRANWTLTQPLDEAAYGEVWLGKHRKTGEFHAFRLCMNAEDLPRMQHELMVVRHLRETLGDQPIAARTLDTQLQEAPYFIESEHVESHSLTAWAAAETDLAEVALATRLEIAAQVTDLVASAHSADVALGNIRPQNILVRESAGIVEQTLLADLSRARIVSDSTELPAEPAERGSAAEPATVAGDVYAVGLLLFQLAAGDLRHPLGPFWERDVDDGLPAEITALIDPDLQARSTDLFAVARRLRQLPSDGLGREETEIEETSRRATLRGPRLFQRLFSRRRPQTDARSDQRS